MLKFIFRKANRERNIKPKIRQVVRSSTDLTGALVTFELQPT